MRFATTTLSLLVVTSLVACADSTDEEDAIADAAPSGKADAPEFPLGQFTTVDIDHEAKEPLIAVFHEDGQLDYTRFEDDYETKYFKGTFKLYEYRGRDRIRLTDKSGNVLLRSDWTVDNCLELGGETFCQSTPPETNVANCIAMQVVDTGLFEEGFTEYEYPDVEIAKDGTSYEITLGSGSLDSSDGPITVTNGARELVANATLGDAKLTLEVANEAPRRGQIRYDDAESDPHLMAHIVCR